MRLGLPKEGGAVARRRSRDPQQEKVYGAEAACGAHESRPFNDIEECRDWITACLNTGLIDQHWPTFRTYQYKQNDPGAFDVRDRRASKDGSVAAASRTEMAFNKAGLRTWIAAHELAHMIAGRHHGRVAVGHGWQFCEVYLKLVGWFIGYKEQAMLREEFDKRGVYYSLEQVTPEWLHKRVGGRG